MSSTYRPLKTDIHALIAVPTVKQSQMIKEEGVTPSDAITPTIDMDEIFKSFEEFHKIVSSGVRFDAPILFKFGNLLTAILRRIHDQLNAYLEDRCNNVDLPRS